MGAGLARRRRPYARIGSWPGRLGALVLPPCHVARPAPRLPVNGAGLTADRLALGLAPGQARADPFPAPGRLAFGHPARERDQDVLHLRGAIQPGLLDRDHDAAALPELAEDAQRVLGALSPARSGPDSTPGPANSRADTSPSTAR
jgi:hypothetical protein